MINGRYTVLDLIGRGGMGCIYKVHDNVLGEDLALKTLLPQFVRDKMVVERFFNEARIARKLAHPNIVRVHDLGSTGKGIYISMEYVQGESLRSILEKMPPGKRLPLSDVLRITDELCVALEYAHQYTVHRDIKPENIMLENNKRVKLMDFGISKLMDNPRMTGASVVMGTPYYMSPEQLRSSADVDQRADIYSMGVVLYELLTGNMPTGVPRPASQMLSELPPEMDDIVAKCVDPEREKRFQNAAELRAAIRPIMNMISRGGAVADRPALRAAKPSESLKIPNRRMLGLLIVVLLVLGMGTALWALQHKWETAGSAVAETASNDSVAGRLAELTRLVEHVKTRVEPLSQNSQEMQAIFNSADRRWQSSLAAQGRDNDEAVANAEDTLQHYLAMALLQDGMTFIPRGTVTVNGVKTLVPGFLIDTFETTVGQFAEFCSSVDGGWRVPEELRSTMESYPSNPMTWVTSFDAAAYAAWRGKSLPTRAQWARAAYGNSGSSDQYPWGAEWNAGVCNCQGQTPMPARSFEKDRTWSGCYDMAGNVAEWTANCPGAETAKREPAFGDEVTVCGGSFASEPVPLNSARTQPFEARAADLGFRCVKNIGTSASDVAVALAALHY